MTVHPQIAIFLEAYYQADLPHMTALSPVAARAQVEMMIKARPQEPVAVAKVEEITIPGPRTPIRLRLYRPPSGDAVPPIVVFYHGGGHVICSLDTHDQIARTLCAGADALVVSVDYRLAPEAKFPAAFEDAVAAANWVAANAARIGGDGGRIAVAGDSAGGNLSAAVALAARDAGGPALRFQLLIYPLTDYRCQAASYGPYGEGHGVLDAPTMHWFREHYLERPDQAMDWRVSPLLADSHADLPPALVITAECDVLHDEGIDYAARLQAAGTPVEQIDYAGMIHGFFGLAPMIDSAVEAQTAACAALRRAFAKA